MTLPALAARLKKVAGPETKAWEVGDAAFRQMAEGCDVIHLGVGDPDIGTPEAIVQAAARAMSGGRTHYAPLAGEPALRATIAKRASAQSGRSLEPTNVCVAAGAQGALFATLQCIAGPGDEVIVVEPYYATYPAVIASTGAQVVRVPAGSGLTFDVAMIERAVTPRTRAILVNTPGNPSGSVLAKADVAALARLAVRQGLWLVSDEVYATLVFETDHVSPLSIAEARDNVIAIGSLSKSHAMTGWRIGWVIGPERLVAGLTDMAQPLWFGVNQFVQDAAVVALGLDETARAICETFRSRRDALAEALRSAPEISFVLPGGGMFLLADVAATGVDGATFARTLLQDEAVAVVPGFGFGASVAHCIRIGFLAESATLREAGARICRHARRLAERRVA